MKITATLFRYLTKIYIVNMLILLLALLSIIYLFDTVELLRRAAKFDNVPIGLVLQISLLKLPEVGQILFPFAILFSAMFTFWQLTKRSELVVMRASGFSVWQFLTPIITIAILTGFMQMMILNPLSSIFLGKFEQLESKYLSHEQNQIAFFKEGLWLRQSYKDKTSKGYIVLHAPKITQPDWILEKPSILFFSNENQFLKRLDAQTGHLKTGQWLFKNAIIHAEQNNVENHDTFILPTQLTIQDVEESFSSPATMSFWRLPAHIKTLENAGFDAARLKIHYHNLLSQPLMFTAMVLLAAMVSMRSSRMKGGLILFGSGIFIGFTLFFFSSFLQALGASGQIPVILAAWSPSIISLLISLSVLLRFEDG